MTAPMKPGDVIAYRCIGRIEPARILAPGESKCLPVERASLDAYRAWSVDGDVAWKESGAAHAALADALDAERGAR